MKNPLIHPSKLRFFLYCMVLVGSAAVFLLIGYLYPAGPLYNLIRFITGLMAIIGLSIVILVWYLAGAPAVFNRDLDDEKADTLMRFNKINAQTQDRRESLFIMFWLVSVVILIVLLYRFVY